MSDYNCQECKKRADTSLDGIHLCWDCYRIEQQVRHDAKSSSGSGSLNTSIIKKCSFGSVYENNSCRNYVYETSSKGVKITPCPDHDCRSEAGKCLGKKCNCWEGKYNITKKKAINEVQADNSLVNVLAERERERERTVLNW